MSERNSRYWIEVRLSVAVRRALTTGVLPKDVAQDLDAAWGELEDYHYDRLSNDSDEGACGRCCIVGEHADEDCPEAPDEDSTDGEDDDPEGILTQRYYDEASDEARAVSVDQAHSEARRVAELARWVPRVTGLHPSAAMVWRVADDAAALERATRAGYASTEASIADLIRRACR